MGPLGTAILALCWTSGLASVQLGMDAGPTNGDPHPTVTTQLPL